MAVYVIAGEAGSEAFAECEYIGHKLQVSAPSVTVHLICKHESEWQNYLDNVCNGYGFQFPSSPIIFTIEGQLIGDKAQFKKHVLIKYGLKVVLKKEDRARRAKFDLDQVNRKMYLEKYGEERDVRIQQHLVQTMRAGGLQLLDGFYSTLIDSGLEFYVKTSHLLSLSEDDLLPILGEQQDLEIAPEIQALKPVEIVEELVEEPEQQEQQGEDDEEEDEAQENDELKPDGEEEENENGEQKELEESSEEVDSLLEFELNDNNLNFFVRKFQGLQDLIGKPEEKVVEIPDKINTVLVDEKFLVENLSNYDLFVNPYPLIPKQMIITPQALKNDEGKYLIRDASLMQNWLKLLNIPPQKPVYKEGELIDPIIPMDAVYVKDFSSSQLSERGFTQSQMNLSLENTHNSNLKLNTIKINYNHLLTESDWEVWYKNVSELNALGFYQQLPYGACHFYPLTSGQMHILPLPLEDISPVPLLNILNLFIPDLEIFKLEEYDFDHIFHKISPSSDPKHLAKIYITCIENLLINEKDFNAGINLILTKDWLFIAPIYNSIGTANEKEVYLNPLAYAGIFHLPYFDKYWPETAGVFKVPRNPYTLLKRTSTFEPIEKDI